MVEKKAEAKEEKKGGDLKAVFKQYAGAKGEMDGRTFFKMFKDKGLVDAKLSETRVDLEFAKFAVMKKLRADKFAAAVEACATMKGISKEAMIEKLCSGGGPQFKGTKAGPVRLHDDKTTYTGVYAKGGPSTVDKDKITSISQTCDRTASDVRGIKK